MRAKIVIASMIAFGAAGYLLWTRPSGHMDRSSKPSSIADENRLRLPSTIAGGPVRAGPQTKKEKWPSEEVEQRFRAFRALAPGYWPDDWVKVHARGTQYSPEDPEGYRKGLDGWQKAFARPQRPLSAEVMRAHVNAGKSDPSRYFAAFNATGDDTFLNEGLAQFPKDPRLLWAWLNYKHNYWTDSTRLAALAEHPDGTFLAQYLRARRDWEGAGDSTAWYDLFNQWKAGTSIPLAAWNREYVMHAYEALLLAGRTSGEATTIPEGHFAASRQIWKELDRAATDLAVDALAHQQASVAGRLLENFFSMEPQFERDPIADGVRVGFLKAFLEAPLNQVVDQEWLAAEIARQRVLSREADSLIRLSEAIRKDTASETAQRYAQLLQREGLDRGRWDLLGQVATQTPTLRR